LVEGLSLATTTSTEKVKNSKKVQAFMASSTVALPSPLLLRVVGLNPATAVSRGGGGGGRAKYEN